MTALSILCTTLGPRLLIHLLELSTCGHSPICHLGDVCGSFRCPKMPLSYLLRIEKATPISTPSPLRFQLLSPLSPASYLKRKCCIATTPSHSTARVLWTKSDLHCVHNPCTGSASVKITQLKSAGALHAHTRTVFGSVNLHIKVADRVFAAGAKR